MTNNQELHDLTQCILQLETLVGAMYDNPLAGGSPSYLASADELSKVIGKASATLQGWKTAGLEAISVVARSNLTDLQDKVSKLQGAVSIIDDAAQGVQAVADVVLAVRNVFGIP